MMHSLAPCTIVLSAWSARFIGHYKGKLKGFFQLCECGTFDTMAKVTRGMPLG